MTAIFWVFVGVAGFAALRCVIGAIQKDMDAAFLWLIAVIVISLIAFTANAIVLDTQYRNMCIDAGYVETMARGSEWYCVSFGNEPRIIKLEQESSQ